MKRPFIIGIGGTCSNSGKTTVGVSLLRHLTKAFAAGQASPCLGHSGAVCPPCGRSWRWGALKYTKTDLDAFFVADKATLSLNRALHRGRR